MVRAINRDQLRKQFDELGFVTSIRVADPFDANRIRDEFDALEAAEGRDRCQVGLVDRHTDVEFVWRLATRPEVLDAVEAVMGPDILLLATHFFCKYPPASGVAGPRVGWARGGTEPESTEEKLAERYVAWHQDVTYWGLEPPYALTAWYAVDDSDVENGCMRVIPGTHDTLRPHRSAERLGNLLSINQEVETAEGEDRAVDLPLLAGEISLHHGLLIHGSNPNRSARRRCGLTIRYVHPGVRVAAANSLNRPWRAILVRGSDPNGHFGRAEAPF